MTSSYTASAQKAVRFASDSAGLEKTLRFLQSLAQVSAAWALTSTQAAPWLQARKQLALGRRYLRFVKFFDAFGVAYDAFGTSNGLPMVLQVGKWSCLGIYLMLESSTILDAMGLWSTQWAPVVFVEAMRFWFYSLIFSMLLSLLQLFQLYNKPALDSGNGQEKTSSETHATSPADAQIKAQEKTLKARTLIRKTITDAFDLLIPGSTTGWIETSTATVGVASTISTVLASTDVWARM